jgi:hypothetical protein
MHAVSSDTNEREYDVVNPGESVSRHDARVMGVFHQPTEP